MHRRRLPNRPGFRAATLRSRRATATPQCRPTSRRCRAGNATSANAIEGQGWFLGLHTFTSYVKVSFFRGTSLRPVPPGGKGEDARWIDIHEDDLDESQMAKWVKQAAALPGWGKS